jgi:hypothetical protein
MSTNARIDIESSIFVFVFITVIYSIFLNKVDRYHCEAAKLGHAKLCIAVEAGSGLTFGHLGEAVF